MSVIAERLEQLIGLAGGLPAEQRRALLTTLLELSKESAASFSPRERETLNAVINQVSETLGNEMLLRINAEAAQALARAVEARALPQVNGVQTEERMIGLLRAGVGQEFLACFARLTALTLEEAAQALRDENGYALAAACQRAGLERSTYSAIVLLSDPRQLRSAKQTQALLRLYDNPPHSEPQVTHQAA
jgi:hypothetical protein